MASIFFIDIISKSIKLYKRLKNKFKEVENMEKLTNLEEMIMKCIWDYGEEIPFLQIGKELKERFGKEYKRTSIRTYLFRLEDKEYLKVDKRGRNAYVYPIISEKEYRKEKAEDILDNWFDGSAKELFTALSEKLAYV